MSKNATTTNPETETAVAVESEVTAPASKYVTPSGVKITGRKGQKEIKGQGTVKDLTAALNASAEKQKDARQWMNPQVTALINYHSEVVGGATLIGQAEPSGKGRTSAVYEFAIKIG